MSKQGEAILILGILTIIPGSYYTRIAYLAFTGVEGYFYSQLGPD
jgi:hypothetical protein